MSLWLSSAARVRSLIARRRTEACIVVSPSKTLLLKPDSPPEELRFGDQEGSAALPLQTQSLAERLDVLDAGEDWKLVLDPGVAPLLQVDSGGMSLDELSWSGLAEFRFKQVLGDRLNEYTVTLESYPRSNRVACAYPSALIASLRTGKIHQSGRLSIVPGLVLAMARARALMTPPQWVVCATVDSWQSALFKDGLLHLGVPVPALAGGEQLSTMLKFEEQLCGGATEHSKPVQMLYLGDRHPVPLIDPTLETTPLDPFNSIC